MDVVLLVGRILLAGIFISSAIGNLSQAANVARMLQAKGVPAANAASISSSIIALLAGISLVFGIWTDLGALLLIVFTIPVTYVMQAFWKETDPLQKRIRTTGFNMNLALIGAALILFYLVNQSQDISLGLTSPLFPRW